MDNRFSEYKKGQSKRLVAISCVLLFLWPAISAFGETIDLLKRPSEKVYWAPASILMDVTKADGRIVTVGEWGHILYSDNQGKDWTQADSPVSVTLTSVLFVTPDKGWATGHEGVVLHTEDGGKTWKKQLDGWRINEMLIKQVKQIYQAKKDLLKKSGMSKKERSALEAAVEDLQWFVDDVEFFKKQGPCQSLLDLWFKNEKEGIVVGSNGVILSTKDGGKTWRPMLDRIENNTGRSYYAIARSANDLFIAGETGIIYRSEDFGQHWQSLKSPYFGSLFGAVGDPSGGFVTVFGQRGNIFYSKDRGKTWIRMKMQRPVDLISGAFLPDGSFCVVGINGVILKSADRGKTLMPLPNRYFGPGIGIAEIQKDVYAVSGFSGISRIEINKPSVNK